MGTIPKVYNKVKPIRSVAAINSLDDKSRYQISKCAVLNSIDPTLNDGTFGRTLTNTRVIMKVALGQKVPLLIKPSRADLEGHNAAWYANHIERDP